MGFSAFARHYLRNHYCFLLLQVLRCFSSLGFLLLLGYWSSTSRVSPFRHLRINARLQLPVAFRSLPRLSSSLRAKASPIRPYSLPFLLLSTCITHLTLSCNSEKSQKRKLLNLNNPLCYTLSLLAKLVNELLGYQAPNLHLAQKTLTITRSRTGYPSCQGIIGCRIKKCC